MPVERRPGLPVDSSLERMDFTVSGVLNVRTGDFRIPIHGGTFNIVSIAAMVSSAPTGAAVIVDINKNGTTIFGTQSNRPTIAISGTAATVGTWSVTSVTTGDYISIDVDQIGSGSAGSWLAVSIRLQRVS